MSRKFLLTLALVAPFVFLPRSEADMKPLTVGDVNGFAVAHGNGEEGTQSDPEQSTCECCRPDPPFPCICIPCP